MLARERVIGAELGEDRDHGLADGVALGALLRGGKGGLKVLEGGGVVAAVPGGKNLVEAVAIPGQAGPGGESGGQEVVREGVDDRQRLVGLTPREQEVLRDLMDGRSAEAIARASYVSLATVRSQIRAVLQKLAVNSQLAAVAKARQAGWRPTSPAP